MLGVDRIYDSDEPLTNPLCLVHCNYCNKIVTKNSFLFHLNKCPEYKINSADPSKSAYSSVSQGTESCGSRPTKRVKLEGNGTYAFETKASIPLQMSPPKIPLDLDSMCSVQSDETPYGCRNPITCSFHSLPSRARVQVKSGMLLVKPQIQSNSQLYQTMWGVGESEGKGQPPTII